MQLSVGSANERATSSWSLSVVWMTLQDSVCELLVEVVTIQWKKRH